MEKRIKVNLTNEQLFWIERTADIESSIIMNKFLEFVKTDVEKLNNKEKDMVKKLGSEFIDAYNFLKELRIKCENLRKNGRK